jgi:hypothetical protein
MYYLYGGLIIKSTKRLDSINAKITELQKLQKKIEEDFVQSISKDIAKIFVKKKVYDIDKPTLLKKIEALIDEIKK